MLKVLSVIGTRPEIIKMAPFIREMRSRPESFDSKVFVTGQHKELAEPYLDLFTIIPDFDLSIMEKIRH